MKVTDLIEQYAKTRPVINSNTRITANRRNVPSKNGGFTLIEMLLSLAIFAMLGVATYTVLNNTINGKSLIEEQAEKLTDLQRAMMFIENDLQQVVQRKIRLNGEEPLEKYFIAEPYLLDSDELGVAFVRDGWINPAMILPRSELQAVGYRIVEGEFQRLYFNFVDADTSSEPKIQPLIADVSEFKLGYYHDNEWQEDLPDEGLPQLVKLSLETKNYGMIERVFSMVGVTEIVAGNTNVPAGGGNSNNGGTDSRNTNNRNTNNLGTPNNNPLNSPSPRNPSGRPGGE